ncbi:MAG TPA: DUF3300 domain-containing protein [Burkholderiales bacterium]|nr:DUF3300 domain-containing protein [Burkholderiales bacterium]
MKRFVIASVCMLAAASAYAQQAGTPPPPPLQVDPALVGSAKFKPEELEAIVAPVALYPDALLAQVLMASTYPLEIVEAARWSKENPGLKDQALQDALQKQSWDPSVKALAGFPSVLQSMNDKLDMTQKLGDAFLAQPKDVTDAVQRLRAKAMAAGNLKSGKELTYTSQKDGDQTIIVIEPTEPEVVYVPAYGPAIYGPWPYPMYPPYYYPPPPAYPAGGFWFGFTVGIIIGGGVWARPVWHTGGVVINVNNFNRVNHTNINNPNWQHSPEHRKGVGYRDQGSRDKFGQGQRPGADTREAYRGRAEAGQRDIARGGPEQFGGGDRGDRGAGAFEGVGRGGESRDFSNRGAASRGGGGFQGGGGFSGGGRGGFGGGGGRGGGRR